MSITAVSPIFHVREVRGRHQIRGNAKGPTERSAKMMQAFRKYHGNFSSAGRIGFETFSVTAISSA